MRLRPQFFLGLSVSVLAAWALLEARSWPIKTALYPRVVSIALLVLSVVETLLSLKPQELADAGQAVDFALSTSVAPDLAARRTAAVFAWLGGFLLAVTLLGFSRAIPLFVFAYLKGPGRETWTVSILLSALAWLAVHLLFVRLLHLPFPDGLLWRALGR